MRSYRRNVEEFVLRFQKMSEHNVGNYTCILVTKDGRQVDQQQVEVSSLPPPPAWDYSDTDKVMGKDKNEYVLKWKGFSRLPIINFILEFQQVGSRQGWISLNIPYQVSTIIYSINNPIQPCLYKSNKISYKVCFLFSNDRKKLYKVY